jgi:hypothetical protein
MHVLYHFTYSRSSKKKVSAQKKLVNQLIEVPRQRLKELGKKLGWGEKDSPGVRYMAEKTGSLEIYTFFTTPLQALFMQVCITFYAWCGGILRRDRTSNNK